MQVRSPPETPHSRGWEDDEIRTLVEAYKVHGSNWKGVLQDPQFSTVFNKRNRTARGLEAKFARLPPEISSGLVAPPSSTKPVRQFKIRARPPPPTTPTTRSSHPSTPSSKPTSRPSSRPPSKPSSKNSSKRSSIEIPQEPKNFCNTRAVHQVSEAILLGSSVKAKDTEAVKRITESILAGNESYHLYNERGLLYLEAMNIPLALYDFERSLSLNPKSVDSRINRAMTNCARKEFLQALEDCNIVLELDSLCVIAVFLRGICMYTVGKPDIAMVDFERVLELNDKFDLARLFLALCYIVIVSCVPESRESFLSKAMALLDEIDPSSLNPAFATFVESLFEAIKLRRSFGLPRK